MRRIGVATCTTSMVGSSSMSSTEEYATSVPGRERACSAPTALLVATPLRLAPAARAALACVPPMKPAPMMPIWVMVPLPMSGDKQLRSTERDSAWLRGQAGRSPVRYRRCRPRGPRPAWLGQPLLKATRQMVSSPADRRLSRGKPQNEHRPLNYCPRHLR